MVEKGDIVPVTVSYRNPRLGTSVEDTVMGEIVDIDYFPRNYHARRNIHDKFPPYHFQVIEFNAQYQKVTIKLSDPPFLKTRRFKAFVTPEGQFLGVTHSNDMPSPVYVDWETKTWRDLPYHAGDI